MPLYLYGCNQCGSHSEFIRGMTESPPMCCGTEMNRLPALPALIRIKGVHSKGYKEDYAKDYRRRLGKE